MTGTSRPVDDLHILTGLDVGGTERALGRYLAATPRAGSAAVLALTGDGPMRAVFEASGVPVHVLGMANGRPDPASVLRFARLVRRLRPRVVAGWLAHGMLAATLAQALVGRSRCGLVWNVRQALHDLAGERAHLRLSLRLLARLSGRPDAIVYNAGTARRQHEAQGFAGARARLLPNGVDTGVYRPDAVARGRVRAAWGIAPDVPLIGHVARIHAQKDHPTLLRAFADLRRQRPDARLMLVGGGTADAVADLRALAADLGLADAAVLTGPREDIASLTAAFDVAVSSSYTEAFPNSVVEAMACGVPVVATDVGDSRDIIGATGAVVAARAPQALAAALSAMLGRAPEARRALGMEARRRVEEHFSLAAMIDGLDAILDSAGPDGGRRGGSTVT